MPEYNDITCGNNSFEEHIQGAFAMLEMAGTILGIGFGCRDSYRALVEVAEEIRRHNNFEPYTATGVGRDILDRGRQVTTRPVSEA